MAVFFYALFITPSLLLLKIFNQLLLMHFRVQYKQACKVMYED